jgi:hypothetical protein
MTYKRSAAPQLLSRQYCRRFTVVSFFWGKWTWKAALFFTRAGISRICGIAERLQALIPVHVPGNLLL